MNYAIVFRLLGYILLCEGGLMCLPALVSALYHEWDVLWIFLFTVALCFVIGLSLTFLKPRRKNFLHAGELRHRGADLGGHQCHGSGALCPVGGHPRPRRRPV